MPRVLGQFGGCVYGQLSQKLHINAENMMLTNIHYSETKEHEMLIIEKLPAQKQEGSSTPSRLYDPEGNFIEYREHGPKGLAGGTVSIGCKGSDIINYSGGHFYGGLISPFFEALRKSFGEVKYTQHPDSKKVAASLIEFFGSHDAKLEKREYPYEGASPFKPFCASQAVEAMRAKGIEQAGGPKANIEIPKRGGGTRSNNPFGH